MGQYFLPLVPKPQPAEARAINLQELRERGKRLGQIVKALQDAYKSTGETTYDYYGYAVKTQDKEGDMGLLIYIPLAPDLARRVIEEAK